MAGKGDGGYSLRITAVDEASKTLGAVNRALAELGAPAKKFNKELGKFADLTGVTKLTQGMDGLRGVALDTFRSMDRITGPLAMITGAASLGGMIALTRQWSEFGTKVSQTAYRLNMPVDKLTAMQGAARLAGTSAEALNAGLAGLGEKLTGAAFGRDAGALQLFHQLGIEVRDSNGEVRQAGDVIGEVANKIAGMKDARTQMRVLEALGLGPELLPLLKDGQKGLDDFARQAAATGGTMTKEMTENAQKMNQAWTRLGLDIEGVGNRLVDSWSGTVTKVLAGTSDWIEHNKGVADSIAEIGAAITGLGSLQAALWVAKLLGIGTGAGIMPLAVGAVGFGAVGAYNGTHNLPMVDENGNLVGNWGGGETPQLPVVEPGKAPGNPIWNAVGKWWNGGSKGGLPPAAGTAAAAVAQRTHDFWRSQGYTENQVAGILAGGPGAESSFDPTAVGDGGTSYGLYQHHNSRWAAMQQRYHTQFPSEAQQNEYAAWEISPGGPLAHVGAALRAATTSQQAALAWTSGFEVPADPSAGMRRGHNSARYIGLYDAGPGAPQAMQGSVQVDVRLSGAPPGTTATVRSSGNVTAPPPTIVQPMNGQ